MKVKIFDVEIDCLSFEEVVSIIIDRAIERKAPQYVVTPNAHHLVKLQQDEEFRQIYRDAFLSVPDGVPLLWVAKLQKTPLKTRVNGTDLMERLCAEAAKKNLKVFFLGGRPGAAKKAAKILIDRHPGLNIHTYFPPYNFERDNRELTKINQMIKATAPHLLFVGLGAPKQEKWMAANYQAIGVPISIGIGVSFEFVAGIVQRAPIWMQKTGLEWLFRFLMEPRRLFMRTLVVNATFIWLFLQQQWSAKH